MCTTREHDHGLPIIMRMAAVKSGQLGLFFFRDNPRKSLSTNILPR